MFLVAIPFWVNLVIERGEGGDLRFVLGVWEILAVPLVMSFYESACTAKSRRHFYLLRKHKYKFGIFERKGLRVSDIQISGDFILSSRQFQTETDRKTLKLRKLSVIQNLW